MTAEKWRSTVVERKHTKMISIYFTCSLWTDGLIDITYILLDPVLENNECDLQNIGNIFLIYFKAFCGHIGPVAKKRKKRKKDRNAPLCFVMGPVCYSSALCLCLFLNLFCMLHGYFSCILLWNSCYVHNSVWYCRCI